MSSRSRSSRSSRSRSKRSRNNEKRPCVGLRGLDCGSSFGSNFTTFVAFGENWLDWSEVTIALPSGSRSSSSVVEVVEVLAV